MVTGKPEVPEKAEKTEKAEIQTKKVSGRNIPEPTADIRREFSRIGECSCVTSHVRNLLQGALTSHGILRMRSVIRLEKQIKEAEERGRWALRDDLKNAKKEEEEDLMAIRTLSDRLAQIPRCDGG